MVKIGFIKADFPADRLRHEIDRITRAGVPTGEIVLGMDCMEAVRRLNHGDLLVIPTLHDVTTSVFSMLHLLWKVADCGATLRSLDEPWLDMESDRCNWPVLMHGMHQFASQSRSGRTKEALRKVKESGKRLGRPKGISADRLKRYETGATLYQSTQMNVQVICETVRVDPRSFYRYLNAVGIPLTRRSGPRINSNFAKEIE